MPTIIGIRFKDSGKVYFFDPNGHDGLIQGDTVVVETVRGPELARVAGSQYDVSDEEVIGELKPVIRRAEDADFARLEMLNANQNDLLARCDEKIREHDLPMRLVKAEYSFDGSRLTFYFTAEKRVDFRMLVRDLARTFRTRIELRQIGPRDAAKLLGGIGPCGRVLCCATFLPDYARVSIKMAKDQDLPLNPSKISGVCGRLLCCLSYEHEQYVQIKAELPRKGAWVQTPEGPGEVIGVNVVRETVMVELASSHVHEEYRPEQVQEATRSVAELARSRNEEGITPAAQKRPAKHHGERRLLRDEIAANPEVLEALAFLEEGEDWSNERGSRPSERRPNRPDDRQRQDDRQRPDQRQHRQQQHHSAGERRPHRPDDRPQRPEQRPEQRQNRPPRATTPPDTPTPPVTERERPRFRKKPGDQRRPADDE